MKKKKEEGNLIRISENAEYSKFVEMGKLIEAGKSKRVCYAIEGNVGYFYYKLKD